MKIRIATALIICIVTFSKATSAQEFEYFGLSFFSTYGASTQFQTEWCKKENDTIVRQGAIRMTGDSVNYFTLTPEDDIEAKINYLDSLLRIEVYTIDLPDGFSDSLKKSMDLKARFQITDDEIDRFIQSDGTILIDTRIIRNIPAERSFSDGHPYWIVLQVKRPGQDTIKYGITGNFSDEVLVQNISGWIPFYLASKKYSYFYKMEDATEYFDDEYLESVVMRYISWTRD